MSIAKKKISDEPLPPALPDKSFGPTQKFVDWLKTLPKPETKETKHKEA